MTTVEPLSNRSQAAVPIIVLMIVATLIIVAVGMVVDFTFTSKPGSTAPADAELIGGKSVDVYFAECVATESVRDLMGQVPDSEIRRRWRETYESTLAQEIAADAERERIQCLVHGR